MRLTVLRLFPDSLNIFLSPKSVQAVLTSTFGYQIYDLSKKDILETSPGNFDLIFEAMVQIIKNLRPGKIKIVISDHFIRYLCFPWNEGFINSNEEFSYAQFLFDDTFGPNSHTDWRIALSHTSPGKSRLIAAAPEALIEGLQLEISKLKIQLVSVKTQLTVSVQSLPKYFSESAWIVSHELGRLTFAALDKDGFQWISSVRTESNDLTYLTECIAQEIRIAGRLHVEESPLKNVFFSSPTVLTGSCITNENIKFHVWNLPKKTLDRLKLRGQKEKINPTVLNDFNQILLGVT